MPISDEYSIEGLDYKLDNLDVYVAYHPIHLEVSIYKPKDDLSEAVASAVKNQLYNNGIQMRALTQLNLPFVTAALDVSQNPNDPYIVTRQASHDLQKIINDNVMLKPKRVYQILSQALNAMINLAENGWQIDSVTPRCIVLDDVHHGNVSFTPIGTTGSQPTAGHTMPSSTTGSFPHTLTLQAETGPTNPFAPTQTLKDRTIEKTQTLQNDTVVNHTPSGLEPTVTLHQTMGPSEARRERGMVQKNMYALGAVAYQLLFGQEYHQQDATTATNIQKLSSKWRSALNTALSPNLEERYDSYEAMLRAIDKARVRNKRIAIALAPLLLSLLIVGFYFAYDRYRRYRIARTPAGQAVESFLGVVDKTADDLPEIQKPTPSAATDERILEPFNHIGVASD